MRDTVDGVHTVDRRLYSRKTWQTTGYPDDYTNAIIHTTDREISKQVFPRHVEGINTDSSLNTTNESRPANLSARLSPSLPTQFSSSAMGDSTWIIISCVVQSAFLLVHTDAATPLPPASSSKPPITQECYTAAVYEHVKYQGTIEEDPRDVMKNNLDAYENATAVAKQKGADIIVFPEYGLFGITNDNRSLIRPYLDDIPSGEERKNPCDDPHPYLNNSFLVTLSCMAKRHGIYLVANVGDMKPCSRATDPECPDDGAYQYNTNVAFDRRGTVISRYHKKHLFYEFKFDVPKQFEYVYFDTEFGRFASFVCFDLVFKPAVTLIEDYGIDTAVFTTWWFDGPPTLLAPQIQQGFAIRNKVNFLASNVHKPNYASLGSGIYAGVNGAVAYTRDPDENPKLVVARIPSTSAPGRICSGQQISEVISFGESSEKIPVPEYSALSSGIDDCAFRKLTRAEDEVDVCTGGVCCSLQYKLSNASAFEDAEEFYLGVCKGNDTNLHERYFWAVEKCYLAKMNPLARRPDPQFATNSSTVFERIEIRGNFSTKYVYPGVVRDGRMLVDKKRWKFEVDEESGRAMIQVQESGDPILIVSLYARAYDRDPPYKQ